MCLVGLVAVTGRVSTWGGDFVELGIGEKFQLLMYMGMVALVFV